MFCAKCGSQINDNAQFCPSCGARCNAAEEFTAIPASEPSVPDAVPVTSFQQTQFIPPANAPVAPQNYVGAQMPAKPPKQPKPPKAKKIYKKASGGAKTLSVFLCLFAFLFGFIALMIGTCRIGLKEEKLRSAYNEGNLATVVVNTSEGRMTVADLILRSVSYDENETPGDINPAWVNEYLNRANVKYFIQNIIVGITRYVFFGEMSADLNSEAVVNKLSEFNNDFMNEIGYSLSEEDFNDIRVRINSGDLNFLSAAGLNSYLAGYGLKLSLIHTVFSLWTMIAFAALAVICLALVFVVNRNNPLVALTFCGVTMIIFGGLNLLVAVAGLVFANIQDIFFLSAVLKNLAFAMGAVSLIVLLLGVCLLLIKIPLKKNHVVV